MSEEATEPKANTLPLESLKARESVAVTQLDGLHKRRAEINAELARDKDSLDTLTKNYEESILAHKKCLEIHHARLLMLERYEKVTKAELETVRKELGSEWELTTTAEEKEIEKVAALLTAE